MKKSIILGLFIFALLSFNSCKTEDDVVFVASNDTSLVFTNTFASEYILSFATSANLGERFTWETADVDVPTNVTYQLQKSLSGDFSDAEQIAATSGNEIALSIGDLLGYANELGLDNDPDTPALNTGTVSFRLRSVVGNDGLENFSPVQTLNLVWLEETESTLPVCDLDQMWLVGAGVTFADWSWETPQKIICSDNGVYSGNIAFRSDNDANFRFFTENANWDTGQNYPFFADAGYTIDANFIQNDDGDSNFKFVGTSGLYYLTVDTVNQIITLDSPTPTGTCDLDQYWAVGAGLADAGWAWETPVQLMCEGNNVYQGWVNYLAEGDANFRFFTINADWDSGQNFPFFADAGYTIDSKLEQNDDGDSNFKFVGETGQYYTVIDTVNKTITLE